MWPGHLGGSMCGGPGMDMKISSTIGFERRTTPRWRSRTRSASSRQALAGLGPQPPNFKAIVALNRGPLLTEGVEVLPLAPRQVEQKRSEGALLVDVRTDQQFDDAHIPGSVSNPMLRAGFGSKLAWLADREQEVVFIGRDDEDGRRAAGLAVAVGLRRLGRLPARRLHELAAGAPRRRGDRAPADRRAHTRPPDPRRPRGDE